jgi:hypothetical protein
MKFTETQFNRCPTALLVAMLTVLAVSALWAARKKEKKAADSAMTERQRAEHALNRLTFGPRPGDVDRVMAMGVDKWIDQQLHPEKIDDSALEVRLASLRTLDMSAQQMVTAFPPRQLVKAVENGRFSMPSDPAERAIYQAQMERMDEKKDGEKPGQLKKAAQQQADQQNGGDDN